jgi:hypothetical protein
MTPDPVSLHARPWSWAQFAMAMGLFPLSFILWLVGMDAAFGPACLIAAPFIAIAGGIWLLALVVRRFTTGWRRSVPIVGALVLSALGLFFGAAAFLSPPGREGEELVFAVLSGALLLGVLGCLVSLLVAK